MTIKSPPLHAQVEIALGLKDLRNDMVFLFVVINSLFILIVLMLTLSKDYLYIEWPLGVVENVTVMEDTQEVSTFLTFFVTEKNRGGPQRAARHGSVLFRNVQCALRAHRVHAHAQQRCSPH